MKKRLPKLVLIAGASLICALIALTGCGPHRYKIDDLKQQFLTEIADW